MNFLVAFVAILFFSALIFWFVKSHTPKKHGVLMLGVGLGVAAALLALALEYLWSLVLGPFILTHHSLVFLESFIGVSLIEEGAKWLFLIALLSGWRRFNFYTDGILCACAIATGFTLVESMLYAYTGSDTGEILIRSITAVPAHFLMAMIMGFLYGRHLIEGKQFLLFSLVIPMIIHGVYDFFIFQQFAELLTGAALLVLLGCGFLSLWVCRTAMRADKVRTATITD